MKDAVLVVMGSDSDYSVMSSCLDMLDAFSIPYRVRICSAHRTPERAAELAKNADDEGYRVIIAAAGLAAHLPGVLAAWTTLPVIGVPIQNGPLNGQDALYSIVQMPTGVPVATVAINGAANAAILAAEMIALYRVPVKEKLIAYKQKLADSVGERQDRLDAKLNRES